MHDIHSSIFFFRFLFLFVVFEDFCITGVVNLDPVCLIEYCSTITIIVREFHNSNEFPYSTFNNHIGETADQVELSTAENFSRRKE